MQSRLREPKVRRFVWALLLATVLMLVWSPSNGYAFDFTISPYSFRGVSWNEARIMTNEFDLINFEDDTLSCAMPVGQDEIANDRYRSWFGAALGWDRSGLGSSISVRQSIRGRIERINIDAYSWQVTAENSGGLWMDCPASAAPSVLNKIMKKFKNETQVSGVADGNFTMLGVKKTYQIPFTAAIPRFKGLYVLSEHGKYDEISAINSQNPGCVIVHGWQNSAYPDYLWVAELGKAIQRSIDNRVAVYAWFWQEESTSWPLPGRAKANISTQASFLTDVLDSAIQSGTELHLIGHSYGGAITAFATKNLADKHENVNNLHLCLLDVPANNKAKVLKGDVQIGKILEGLSTVNITNLYSEFGVEYVLPNVINEAIGGDHKEPIRYLINGGLDHIW